MKRKQWRMLLAVTAMMGILGAVGCGNKAETGNTADDAVAVMAGAAIDGEMQDRTETQTGEAEAGSSGEMQDSEPAAENSGEMQSSEMLPTEEASPDSSAEAEPMGNSTPELPPAFREEMEANISILKSTIESLKAQKEAAEKAEAERKEAERKEAEARAAEEKAQAEATAQPASSSNDDIQWIEAGVIYEDPSLLEKVNVDRANNGAAELQWSDSLAQYCRDRIPVIKYNILNGIWAHEGASQTENLTYGAVFTSSEANQNWIDSEGHHNSRINSGYTMYAAVAYYDDECIIWMEAFE